MSKKLSLYHETLMDCIGDNAALLIDKLIESKKDVVWMRRTFKTGVMYSLFVNGVEVANVAEKDTTKEHAAIKKILMDLAGVTSAPVKEPAMEFAAADVPAVTMKSLAQPVNLPKASFEQAMKLPVNKLANATLLGEPVKASNADSVYHVVALVPGLRLAARITHQGNLSIRAEGDIVKFTPALKEQKFGISGHYASVHFQCNTVDLACKTLGAVLLALGIEFSEMLTNAKKIVGKGV